MTKFDSYSLLCEFIQDYGVSDINDDSFEVVRGLIEMQSEGTTYDANRDMWQGLGGWFKDLTHEILSRPSSSVHDPLVSSLVVTISNSSKTSYVRDLKASWAAFCQETAIYAVVNHVSYSSHLPEDIQSFVSVRNLEVAEPELVTKPLNVDASLNFLRLFWAMAHRVHVPVVDPILSALFQLMRTTDKLRSNKAKFVLHTLLCKLLTAETDGMISTRIMCLSWSNIQLLLEDDNVQQRTGAYSIWLRLCMFHDHSQSHIMMEAMYWKMLRIGLATGLPEQQKLCLAILRESLQTVRLLKMAPQELGRGINQPAHARLFDKYMAIYETVVLGRYVNQVEECLPELKSLCQQNSVVPAHWIFVFLSATLSRSMQDSVRRIIGRWILDFGAKYISEQQEYSRTFIVTYFLPWATTGKLYVTAQNSGQGKHARCKQGDRLVAFIRDVLQSMSDSSCGLIARDILNYIDEQGRHMYTFARAFTLQGILDGLFGRKPCLPRGAFPPLRRIAWLHGWEVIAQDLMFTQCAYIAKKLEYGYDNIDSECFSRTLTELSRCFKPGHYLYPGSLRKSNAEPILGPFNARLQEHSYIQDLLKKLKLTAPSFQRTLALIDVCHSLLAYLNSLSAAEESVENVRTIVSALYTEIISLDKPREALIIFPAILLHPILVSYLSQNYVFEKLVIQIFQEIKMLMVNKIYVFTAIAPAIRRLWLEVARLPDFLGSEFLVFFAENPPRTRVEFELEANMARLLQQLVPEASYERYYGPAAAYGYACIFDGINRLPKGEYWTAACRKILWDLLPRWQNQTEPVAAFAPWKSTTQLQIILLLVERLSHSENTKHLLSVADTLWQILFLEPLPRSRYILEWALIRTIRRLTVQQFDLLRQLRKAQTNHPMQSVSKLRVLLGLAQLPECPEEFAFELCCNLIAYATSSKRAIRHEAQWMFPILWSCAERRGWTSILKNDALLSFDLHIRSFDIFDNPPQAKQNGRFDAVHDHSLANLISGSYLRLEPPEPVILEPVDIEAVLRNDQWNNSNVRQDEELISLGTSIGEVSAQILEHMNLSESPQIGGGGPEHESLLQTKGKAAASALSELISDSLSSSQRPTELIVVATLVDSTYNLGGLSRICEIYGVKALYIKEQSVVSSPQFKSTALSSQRWLPIKQLHEADLIKYFTNCRLDGYTIIGLEQTNASKTLGTDGCKIDPKSVIVIGSEATGLPGLILAEMDYCIEIGQIGVTRSANVQTAAAIVLYEYWRQNSWPSCLNRYHAYEAQVNWIRA